MRRTSLLSALVFLVGSIAYGQDPVKVAPKLCKVEFENEQVRVLRWKLGPHEKVPMHEHPAMVTIALTGANIRYTLSDGKTRGFQGKAGEVTWTPAEKHSAEILNDKPSESIQVELKGK